MKPILINVLRWVAVLPGSVAAMLLSYIIVKVFYRFVAMFYGGMWLQDYVVPAVASFGCGYYFVIAGALIAPSHTKYAALALMILMIFYMGLFTLTFISQRHFMTLWEEVFIVGGSIGAYVFVSKEELME